MKTTSLISFLLLSTFASQLSTAFAQGTAFTYQGRLNDNGAPAGGIYDLRFTIYDSTNNPGTVIAGPLTNSPVAVTNGVFATTLDFGVNVFTGADRWLEIEVRTNGSSAGFTILNPRQLVAATPYAITAGNISGSVSASQLSGSIAPANIGAGTITSTMLAAGSVTTSNLVNGAVTLAKLNTSPVWTSSATFTNPTPAIGDNFGTALAAVGTDRVIIGAQWDDPGVNGAGAAYLFSTNGTLLTTFTNPSPAQEDIFGNALSSVGGDKLIISAYQKDVAGATNTGAAYLFNTNGTLLITFTNPTPALDDNFGWAVAGVGTNKIVIAANNDSTGATNAGAAYVYSLNGTLLVTITNPTPAVGDQFGYQLAAVGTDKILISSVANDTGGTNAGAAYLFSTNGALLTTFTNPMPVQSVFFGLRIAAAGNDRVLISGALSDFTTGVAFLYSINGTLLATFGPAPLIGASLAFLSPDKVAIGAAGDGAGSVHLFTTNGAPLATIANPNPVNGAYFGYSLAAIGGRLLIGVPQDNTGASGAGVAHLFGIGAQYIPGLVGDGSFAANPGNIAIDSSRIVDGTIAEVDLADGAVSDAKISNVDASKLTGTVQDALLSPNVALLNANQTFTGQNTFNNPANSFAGDGSGLANVNAATLGGIGPNSFWRTVGNAGTTPGANSLGTTDNQPLEFQVNATRALRIEPHGASAPSLVGGYFQNSVASYQGAVVAGGGTSGSPNYALGNYAFVGAGHGGQAAAYSAVVAGAYNDSPGSFSFIGSGEANTNSVIYSFIGGGKNNSIQPFAYNSILGGGENNSIQTNANYSFLGGGENNSIQPNAGFSVLAGGGGNSIQLNAYYSVLGGGNGNSIQANAGSSVLGGGANNSIQTNAYLSFLGGGANNFILPNANVSVLGGGSDNSIRPLASYSVLGGGQNNSIQTNAYYSVVGGGWRNSILPNGQYAIIPGGQDNTATNYAFAAGRQAKANHQGSFVWADSTGADFASTAANQFNIRAQGGVRLNTDTSVFFGNQTRQMLNLWSTNYGIGVQNSAAYFRTDQEFMWYRRGSHSDTFGDPGAGGSQLMRLGINGELIIAGTLSQGSDRNIKQDFAAVDPREVLEKVAAMDVRSWSYTNDPACRHLGPVAQDFHAAFGLNGDDDKHITTVDADGVALAAIQGLNQKVEEQRAELQQKGTEITELKHRLERLESLINERNGDAR